MVNQPERFYKNPTDTYVFIENIWMDDIYRVDFNRNFSRSPQYGYRDKRYGQISEGRELITGNIVINFSEPGYLSAAIAGLQSNYPNKVNTKNPYNEIENLKKEINSRIEEIYQTYEPGSAERRQGIARLYSYAASVGMSEYTTSIFRDAFAKTEPKKVRNSYTFVDPFEQKRHFNIQLYYGHPDDPDAIVEELEMCALLGQSKTMSAAGSPNGDMSSSAQVILEVYPFVARNIRYIENSKGVN